VFLRKLLIVLGFALVAMALVLTFSVRDLPGLGGFHGHIVSRRTWFSFYIEKHRRRFVRHEGVVLSGVSDAKVRASLEKVFRAEDGWRWWSEYSTWMASAPSGDVLISLRKDGGTLVEQHLEISALDALIVKARHFPNEPFRSSGEPPNYF
jgi:hypothetical protein